MLDQLKRWAHAVKRDATALYFAARDPRVPWYAKVVAIAVAAYAVSPIDPIPDFIPLLGLLDELIVLPLGILLAVWMIPPEIMAEHRTTALGRPLQVSRTAAIFIVLTWIALLGFAGWWAWRVFRT